MKELRWQTLDQRRDYDVATLVYRCVNEEAPVRLINELVMTADTHDFPTRSASQGNVQIPEPKVELFRQSFRYQGALLWNKLPSELKNVNDIATFKYMYKKLFF